jgi:hypothetical protein
MLEQQIKFLPNYDKYPLILNYFYSTLEQDDYFINKCYSKTSKKALTFSQFRMWEEVNSELNSALSEIFSNDEDLKVDLKYANEFDLKLWENIHPEGIVQIGDLDRTKFFPERQTNPNNYGAFKAEFRKWMILAKSQSPYQVFEGNREKL